MQKIEPDQILAFMSMLALIVLSAVLTTWLLYDFAAILGEFRAIAVVAVGAALVYAYALVVYRIFLVVCPLREGVVKAGSAEAFAAQVNILFYLILFNSLIRSHVLPIPVLRLFYLALGAKLGKDTYSAGAILDPALTSVGDSCIVGHDAVLYSHAIEGERFSLAAIRIGHRVTVGAHAIVMSGVVIGDDAVVSAGAVVTKDSIIAPGEIWGGVPAKRLRGRTPEEAV